MDLNSPSLSNHEITTATRKGAVLSILLPLSFQLADLKPG